MYDILHDLERGRVQPYRPAHLQAPPSNVHNELDGMDDNDLETSLDAQITTNAIKDAVELFLADGEFVESRLRFTRELDVSQRY